MAQEKYLLLTTFTTDGRPKPTAVRGGIDKVHSAIEVEPAAEP